jgi:hypothetical protein
VIAAHAAVASPSQGAGRKVKTMHESHNASSATPLHDRLEFRLLIAIAVPWFLFVAAASRLLPRAWRPLASSGAQESLLTEAKRTAYTVIPYAFMR